MLSSLKSFRRIASAEGESAPGAATSLFDEVRLADLSPPQRSARRLEMSLALHERAAKGLPDGWTAKRSGDVYALSHVDDKTTAKFCADANAVFRFLDDNLGFVGPGEYMRPPLLRICADSDEYRVYHKGTAWSWDNEIVTYKDTGSRAFTTGDVTSECAEHWLRERDNDLYGAMPAWLRYGWSDAFGNARAKGKSLEFFDDSWERVDVAEQIRDRKVSTLDELMHMDSEQLWSDQNRRSECTAAVRFLLSGPKKGRDALRAYLEALGPYARKLREERKKMPGPSADKPKTEEEEDAQFRAARTKERESDRKMLEEIFDAAFAAWPPADWKSLESAYSKSLR